MEDADVIDRSLLGPSNVSQHAGGWRHVETLIVPAEEAGDLSDSGPVTDTDGGLI
jgi:hypothetical protein